MLRWFLILLLAWLAYRLLLPRRRPTREGGSAGATERMVSCAECGLNIPESEALVLDGRHFCGEPHRQSWMRSH